MRSLVALSDGLAIATASLLFFSSDIEARGGWEADDLGPYLGIAGLNTYLVLQSFVIAGMYRLNALTQPRAPLLRIAILSVQGTLVLVFLGSVLNIGDPHPGESATIALLATLLLVCLGRAVAFVAVRDLRVINRRIVVYGVTEHGRRLLRTLRQKCQPWDEVVGVFDDGSEGLAEVEGYPVLGNSDQMIEIARKLRVDEVLVAAPWEPPEQTELVIDKLTFLPANVRLAPDPVPITQFPGSRLNFHYGRPMLSVAEKPIEGSDALLKTVFDYVFGLPLLIALSPLLVLIAAAIKLDSPGPVFFVQQRYGFNHELILVWKFRTMHVARQDEYADQLTTRNDPRVTRVGALLRRLSFDELPQLINVLRGEMSLVGPRPHALHAKAAGKLYQDAVARYAARHKVKPGITGWAQVNGWRGETDTEEKIRKRVAHDLYYIEHWSLLLDIKILALTPLAVWSGKNSY